MSADWPQWMGPERDGIWREAVPETFAEGGPVRVWEVPAGGGYAGPAVAGGRVFVTDRHIDPAGDTSNGVPGTERIRCLDAETGETLWEHSWPAVYTIDYRSGPRATPTVHDGLVYVLGAEGYFACYSVADGSRKWHHELTEVCRTKPATWGFSGHPLVWNDLVIVLGGGEGATCVAFDRRTGEEKWRALSSRQSGYCPPALIRQDGKDAVFLWHGEALNALEPATGRVLWSIPKETRYGVSMAGPVQKGNHLFVSAFWWGSRLLELPEGEEAGTEPVTLWETEREGERRGTHLNALMCTPLLVDDHVYGVCAYGQLRCLEFRSGRRVWETFAATTGDKGEVRYGHAFLTRIGTSGNRFLLFNDQGELISARLTPEGYHELARAKLIEPDNNDAGRPVVWSHPAYSNGCIFVRNDSMVRCYRLAPAPVAE